jgi:hypothetical protein
MEADGKTLLFVLVANPFHARAIAGGLQSSPRRTGQLWCLHSALNDAVQLESLNTIGGSGHAGYRLRKAGDAPTPSVDLHSI